MRHAGTGHGSVTILGNRTVYFRLPHLGQVNTALLIRN